MKKFFKYLRRQPKNVRDNYALLFSGIFVLLVVSFWLPAQFGDKEVENVAEATENKEQPFGTLLKGIKDQFASALSSMTGANAEVGTENSETIKVHQGGAGEFVLSEEDVAALKLKMEESRTEVEVAPSGVYQEVVIATTSATSSVKTEAE